MWCEIALAAIFYMPHSYLVVAGASRNQRSIAYVWAMTIFTHSMGLSVSFVSNWVDISLIDATRAIWRHCVDIKQGPDIFRQWLPWKHSRESTAYLCISKGGKDYLECAGTPGTIFVPCRSSAKVFQGHSNIYIGHCCDAQHVSIKSNLEICSPWKFKYF